MARILRRAVRLLVTAGAMGAVPLALAGPPDPDSADVPTGVHLIENVHVTLGQVKMEAMKVEMALLADPSTYQLPVTVQVKGNTLELLGQVANEAAMKRALEIARQACYLPVHNGLSVLAAGSSRRMSPEALRNAVRKCLIDHLGSAAAGFDIQAAENGRVCLRGEVGSMEDKLTASRCLHGLEGCGSIVNCLGVKAIKQGGYTFTLVTSDGRHAVTGAVAASSETPAAGTTAKVEELPPPPERFRPGATATAVGPPAPVGSPAPVVVLPSGLPLARSMNLTMVRPSVPAPVPQPIIHVQTGSDSSPYARQASPYGSVYSPSTQPAPTAPPRSFWDRLIGRNPDPQPTVRLAQTTQPTPSTFPTGYATRPPGYATLSPQAQPGCPSCMAGSTGVQLAVTAPAPQPSFWELLTGAHKTKPPSMTLSSTQTPSPSVIKVSSEPPIDTSRPVVKASLPSSLPLDTYRPVVKVANPSPPPIDTSRTVVKAAPPSFPPRPVPPQAAAAQPEVKAASATDSGVQPATPSLPGAPFQPKPLIVSRKTPSPGVPVSAASKTDAAQMSWTGAPAGPPVNVPANALRTAVQKSCGQLAREVRVETTPDHLMVVHVIASPAKEQELISVLLGVPEISATNVKLEIHMTP